MNDAILEPKTLNAQRPTFNAQWRMSRSSASVPVRHDKATTVATIRVVETVKAANR
jgi:hypothetical protein